jgi:hypothetical protein
MAERGSGTDFQKKRNKNLRKSMATCTPFPPKKRDEDLRLNEDEALICIQSTIGILISYSSATFMGISLSGQIF